MPRGTPLRCCAPSSPKLWLRSLQHALSLRIHQPGHDRATNDPGALGALGQFGEHMAHGFSHVFSQGPASFLNLPLSLTICIQPQLMPMPSWGLISSEIRWDHPTWYSQQLWFSVAIGIYSLANPQGLAVCSATLFKEVLDVTCFMNSCFLRK